MRVDRETGYVLHTRSYRENSQLVDLFTRQYGRLRVVARSARGGNKRGGRPGLQLFPFTPLQLSWQGRSELKTLVSAEILAAPVTMHLQGETLYSGFYLNELLMRLLAEHDPHHQLFDCYRETVSALAAGEPLEKTLRLFELTLLEEIGYGLMLDCDTETGEAIASDAWYRFDQEQGLIRSQPPAGMQGKANWFSGQHLLAMANLDTSSAAVLKDAKRLLRLALQAHLGDKPLRSRELFLRAGK